MKNLGKTEVELLEKYRISLENLHKEKIIAKKMAELGYDKNEIEKGQKILENTQEIYNKNKWEHDVTFEKHSDFETAKINLYELYKVHKAKCKVIFRNDFDVLKKLDLDKEMPHSYLKWLEVIKVLYNVLLCDEHLQKKILRLKITKEQLLKGEKLIEILEDKRADYLEEKNESEEMVKDKNKAFEKIENYMEDFYAVLKIAKKEY